MSATDKAITVSIETEGRIASGTWYRATARAGPRGAYLGPWRQTRCEAERDARAVLAALVEKLKAAR